MTKSASSIIQPRSTSHDLLEGIYRGKERGWIAVAQETLAAEEVGGGRLMSLDVFRGATIAAMILVSNPGPRKFAYSPFHHAEWHGWTFADLIFPAFLWIVGVALVLSLARRVERGDSKLQLFFHAVRRSAIIFALGLFLNAFPDFELSTLHIPGVLQRIAVCYLIATVICLTTSKRGLVLWTTGLLAGYWLLMRFWPVPGFGSGNLDMEGNFAHYVDSLFLTGHLAKSTKTWDPEGLVSTLPAIASTLFGVMGGHLVRSRQPEAKKAAWMFTFGSLLVFAGWICNFWLPINKNLWTSSFSLFTAGIAFLIFALCYWVVDVNGYKWWAKPLAIYGMNAIGIYFLAEILARLSGRFEEAIFKKVLFPLASPAQAWLLFAMSYVLLFFVVSLLMYRKRWFVKV